MSPPAMLLGFSGLLLLLLAGYASFFNSTMLDYRQLIYVIGLGLALLIMFGALAIIEVDRRLRRLEAIE